MKKVLLLTSLVVIGSGSLVCDVFASNTSVMPQDLSTSPDSPSTSSPTFSNYVKAYGELSSMISKGDANQVFNAVNEFVKNNSDILEGFEDTKKIEENPNLGEVLNYVDSLLQFIQGKKSEFKNNTPVKSSIDATIVKINTMKESQEKLTEELKKLNQEMENKKAEIAKANNQIVCLQKNKEDNQVMLEYLQGRISTLTSELQICEKNYNNAKISLNKIIQATNGISQDDTSSVSKSPLSSSSSSSATPRKRKKPVDLMRKLNR